MQEKYFIGKRLEQGLERLEKAEKRPENAKRHALHPIP
jgi:hypothetical protein